MAKLPKLIRESKVYKTLTYDITMRDIVGSARFEHMGQTKTYRFLGDWIGMAMNKVILGMYMDSQAGMLPGTSVLARGISLGVHSVTSPPYTVVRDYIYRNGNITPERSPIMRYGADLLAFNAFQTPLYVAQVAAAVGIRAALDPSVDIDPHTISNAAIKFFENSWWLAFAGKWSMDGFRRFLGSKIPEQLAVKDRQGLEAIVTE